MHWGTVVRTARWEEEAAAAAGAAVASTWVAPAEEDWPPATHLTTEGTAETPMVQLPVGEGSAGFHSTAVLHFDLATAPRAVHFVLQNRDNGKWYAFVAYAPLTPYG